MTGTEIVLFWITVALYAVGFALFLLGLVFRKDRSIPFATGAVLSGAGTHLATIMARGLTTGRIPVVGHYENALLGAWVVIVFSFLILLWRRTLALLLVGSAPFALLMLGYGFLSHPEIEPTSLVLDNLWIIVHIFFAWLAYGSYAVATALAVVYLLRARYREPDIPGVYRRLPDSEVIDELVFRFILFGFVTDAAMIAAGAIWAKDLWGTYWSWDPVETWSLVSWLIYGLYIHLRLTFGWRGKKAAWLAIVSIAGVVLAFWGASLLGPSLHDFQTFGT